MKALKHHPGMWMRDDAADAMNALEDKHGPIRINRAGVTEAEQQKVIDDWDRGGPQNRPPFLYPPARPAKTSTHVQGTGVDVYNYTSDRAKLNEFGFEWYGTSDVVHYTFKGRAQTPLPVVTDAGGKVAGVHGPNPFGIPFTGGLQKIAKRYGYTGPLDQHWKSSRPTIAAQSGSMKGFVRFLRQNYGYVGNDVLGPVMWAAIARWLRATKRYDGDDIPGPRMRSALSVADTENWQAL